MVAGILNLLVGLITENPPQLILGPVVGAIVYRAIFPIGVGYTLQVWGQRHTTPTDAGLILGLEAVFALIAGFLFLQQLLFPIQLLGCVIILASVLFAQFKGNKYVHQT